LYIDIKSDLEPSGLSVQSITGKNVHFLDECETLVPFRRFDDGGGESIFRAKLPLRSEFQTSGCTIAVSGVVHLANGVDIEFRRTIDVPVTRRYYVYCGWYRFLYLSRL